MMKCVIFDSGPVISFTVNNLLDVLTSLKEIFDGKFYICPAVKEELIDVPFTGKKFKFEALQVMKLIEEGTLEIIENNKISDLGEQLMDLANKCFMIKGKYINIVQTGEMESLAAAIFTNADAFVVDERTIRLLVEDPESLEKSLYYKMHTDVKIDLNNVTKFRQIIGNVKIIRSLELVTVAFERGLLDKYLPKKAIIPTARKDLLDSILWGLKLNGCAVSEDDILEALRIERLN